ncbi:hypothetical protein A3762_08470 [Oleiphilus sp. HI0125]|uniref:cytochrome c-type biogenesis protein n=2 Tax=Oleiphilus sp. HI0125 TaxID=1822266 RepID=UPI0007C3817D|nr:cytochrome c-type biogenesis protein [Oleiphilus sp. HI0125]KZZ58142.1 hypothetical protein A3762_08470 [Oleiphilus sp. HI0125]
MRFVLLFVLAIGFESLNADIDVYEFSSETKLESYQALTRELRCPKCQNQDIADSNAPIAQDMRAQVHRLVEDGHSHDEVVDFMIQRFGEFVTYKPPVRSETYLLWYGPWVFIAIGLIAIIGISRSKRISVDTNGATGSTGSSLKVDNSDDQAELEALLKKYSDD